MSEIPEWEMEDYWHQIKKKFGIKFADPIECSLIALFMDARGFTQYSARPDVTPFDIGQYLSILQLGVRGWFCFPRLPWGIKLPNGNPAQQIVGQDHEPVWTDPVQIKFMGDGVMLLWEYHDNIECEVLLANIFLRCWIAIDSSYKECGKLPFMPPSDLVFGLAHGRGAKFYNEIHAPGLPKKSQYDYEFGGFCINLASRLVSCHETSGLLADENGLISRAYSRIKTQVCVPPERPEVQLKGIGIRKPYKWTLPPSQH